MKTTYLAFLLSLTLLRLNGQSVDSPCAFDEYTNNKSILKAEELIKKGVTEIQKRNAAKSLVSDTKIIPVVIHVIHNGGNENISEAQVQSAIDVLNEDYGRLAGTPGEGAGVDTKVRFMLANIDPNGNCTNGIVRIKSTLTDHKTYERATLKELSFWDNEKYLNMYIVKTITGGVLGYSSFPGGPADEDGIVVKNSVFGRIGTAASSMGRTTSHELGHWFGLYHTFNNGCGTDLCTDGDYVCDTPPQLEPSFNCNTLNTCSNDSPDMDDQKENYMNYTNDACKNMFTAGQRDRLQSSLENIRTVIWSQANLVATGTDSSYVAPATCGLSADFVTLTTELCTGNSVYFIDKTLNDATSWKWYFEGATPPTSLDQNPTITYNNNGVFDVKLVVSDSTTSDSTVFSNYISVTPPTIGDSLSFAQDLDEGIYPPTSIIINNYDGGITWELDSMASTSGKYSLKINNLINTNYGSSDELILPPFDFTTAHPDSTLKMTFKWAYARSDASFSDEMIVLVSTDCGVTFTQKFYRTGNSLVTGPTQTTPFVPDSTEWKDAYIFLSTLKAEQNVQIKIVNVTDGGNNLYIDDIYVGDGSEALPLPTNITENKEQKSTIKIYPNPTNENAIVAYTVEKETAIIIAIYNLNGQLIQTINEGVKAKGAYEIILPSKTLPQGMYFVKLNNRKVMKFIKK